MSTNDIVDKYRHTPLSQEQIEVPPRRHVRTAESHRSAAGPQQHQLQVGVIRAPDLRLAGALATRQGINPWAEEEQQQRLEHRNKQFA